MSETKVSQEGNVVEGHLAGRDVNVTSHTVIQQVAQQGSLMRTLIAQYREELKSSPAFRQVIDELQHYLAHADEVAVVGLEFKLKEASRQDEIKRALKLKELFVKKLASRYFSETAQHIYAYILGRIYQLFKIEIRPLLYDKAHDFVVDKAVIERVLNPILVELEDNVLLIKHDELEGMLYFLTGNCHLRWVAPC